MTICCPSCNLTQPLPEHWYSMQGVEAPPIGTPAAPQFSDLAVVPATSWVPIVDFHQRMLSFSTQGAVEQYIAQKGFVQSSDPLIWVVQPDFNTVVDNIFASPPAIFVETTRYTQIRVVVMRVYA